LFFLMQLSTAQQPIKPKYQRQWMLISFSGFDKNFLMQQKAELNLDNHQQQYSAIMGCNQMMVTGKVKAKSLQLDVTGATMSYCEGNMDLERKFAAALPTMKRYKIQGHFLTLYNSKGEQMKFVAADWD
jgi:heat shock protein HslJ